MELTFDIKQEIVKHALEESDIEVCGFVLNDGTVKRAENIVDTFTATELKAMGLEPIAEDDPRSHFFVMDKASQDFFLFNRKDIAAIYHSHCRVDKPGYLSQTDCLNAIKTKVPYLLYHCHPDIDSWDLFDPSELHPYPLQNKQQYNPKQLEFYLGWPYQHPRCDCLTLFRNYFIGRLGIYINDYPRPKDPMEYFKGQWNDYDENLGKEGFVKVDAPTKENDLILMRMRGRMPHHIAIMLDPKTGKALHCYPDDKVSKPFVFAGRAWLDKVHSYWRHKDFL